MTQVRATTTIPRPIDEVYAVLTDVEQTGRWFPGDLEEHWTSPPPHGLGSTRHAIVRMGGRRVENDAVVTVQEPPHRAGMRGTSPSAPFDALLTFAEVPGGTRVDVVIDLRARGATRLVMPLFAAWYGRQWTRGLANLQALMASGEL